MDRRGWVGWIEGNPVIAAGLAVCLVMVTASLAVLAARVDDGGDQNLAAGGRSGTTFDTGPTSSLLPGETSTTLADGPGTGPGATTRTANTLVPPKPTANVIPGTKALPPCAPDRNYRKDFIGPDFVNVGQIVSDVNILPAQFRPMKEGLEAYVKLINAAGGVCGRKIVIDYSNDQANPATHDYEAMAQRNFAFVSNGSLMDSLDYEAAPPFNPRFNDDGEFVPDIGGLALSYGRSQSPWYAGVIGSISPVLVGGGQVRYYLDRAKAEGRPCAKAGVLYLREPTGASNDQGSLGKVALEAPWGGNLGAGNAILYQRDLADPVPVYEVMVRQMIADGVRCVFTYADLGSDINLVKAMNSQGVWPPRPNCPTCFSIVYVPFAAYDPKFIRDGGAGAQMVNTFLPHVPLHETGGAAMQAYLNALKQVENSGPSTFSLMAFLSGQLFVDAIGSCGSAPTRACVMQQLRATKDFTGGGLLGGVTPFRSTRVRCNGDCGSFQANATWDWKWIANCTVSVRVQGNGWVRDNPAQGFACDQLQVARGTPA